MKYLLPILELLGVLLLIYVAIETVCIGARTSAGAAARAWHRRHQRSLPEPAPGLQSQEG